MVPPSAPRLTRCWPASTPEGAKAHRPTLRRTYATHATDHTTARRDGRRKVPNLPSSPAPPLRPEIGPSFDRYPKCATRFDSLARGMLSAPAAGLHFFEAAERAGRGRGSTQPGSPWLIVALVIGIFIALLLLLR